MFRTSLKFFYSNFRRYLSIKSIKYIFSQLNPYRKNLILKNLKDMVKTHCVEIYHQRCYLGVTYATIWKRKSTNL